MFDYWKRLNILFQIDGSVDIPINLARDLGLKEDTMALEIDVIAEVEEYLTKRKYNATNILKVYDRDIKVEMVKSAESFKPGLKYTAHVSLDFRMKNLCVILYDLYVF